MKKKGQSILEYAIVLAAVIAVITLVARGMLSETLQGALETATDRIATEAEDLSK